MGNLKPGDAPDRRHKRRKSRRGKKPSHKVHLSADDIEFLKRNTKFDEAEIREWFKGFKVRQKKARHE